MRNNSDLGRFKDIRKILFISPIVGMGEVTFILRTLNIFRNNMPITRIHFLSGRYSYNFLKHINGLDECISLESLNIPFNMMNSISGKISFLLSLPRLFRFFLSQRYEICVVSSRGKFFSIAIKFILKLSGVKEVIMMMPLLGRFLNPQTHVIDSYKQILSFMGFDTKADSNGKFLTSVKAKEYAEAFLKQNKIDKNIHTIIGICPFSLKRIKDWSAQKFANLINELQSDKSIRVIIFGYKDQNRINDLLEMIKHKPPIVGEIPFDLLIGLIDMCDHFISVDTGPMHIASVLNVKTIGIFGPTSGTMYGPYGDKNIVLQEKIDCPYYQPTFMGSGRIQKCYKEDRCLISDESCVNRINVEKVINALNKQMSDSNHNKSKEIFR